MASPLSSLLLQHQLVSLAHLHEAFALQAEYGGTLDTVLFEESRIDEPTLTAQLSMALGLPPIPPNWPDLLDERVILRLDAAQTAPFSCCPIRIDQKRVSVLVSEQTDVVALQELAFARDCAITCYSAPQFRVEQARSLIYGQPLLPRWVALVQRFGDWDEPKFNETQTVIGRSSLIEETNAALARELTFWDADAVVDAVFAPPARLDHIYTAQVELLRQATNRDMILDLMAQLCQSVLSGTAWFVVKNTAAVEYVERQRSIDLTRPSVVARCVEGGALFLGHAPSTDDSVSVLQAADLPIQRLAVVPLRVRQKPVCLLVGQYRDTAGASEAVLRTMLLRLAEAAENALAELILKNKKSE